jgi:hypothetical protein
MFPDFLKAVVRRTKPELSLELGSTFSHVLSQDSATRAIEMAFLRRICDVSEADTRSVPKNLSRTRPDTVSASLQAMHNPVFAELAAELERELPMDATFGRFKDDAQSVVNKP